MSTINTNSQMNVPGSITDKQDAPSSSTLVNGHEVTSSGPKVEQAKEKLKRGLSAINETDKQPISSIKHTFSSTSSEPEKMSESITHAATDARIISQSATSETSSNTSPLSAAPAKTSDTSQTTLDEVPQREVPTKPLSSLPTAEQQQIFIKQLSLIPADHQDIKPTHLATYKNLCTTAQQINTQEITEQCAYRGVSLLKSPNLHIRDKIEIYNTICSLAQKTDNNDLQKQCATEGKLLLKSTHISIKQKAEVLSTYTKFAIKNLMSKILASLKKLLDSNKDGISEKDNKELVKLTKAVEKKPSIGILKKLKRFLNALILKIKNPTKALTNIEEEITTTIKSVENLPNSSSQKKEEKLASVGKQESPADSPVVSQDQTIAKAEISSLLPGLQLTDTQCTILKHECSAALTAAATIQEKLKQYDTNSSLQAISRAEYEQLTQPITKAIRFQNKMHNICMQANIDLTTMLSFMTGLQTIKNQLKAYIAPDSQ